jgi:hypothetical protein
MAHFNQQQRGDNSGEYNNNKENVRERERERDDRDRRDRRDDRDSRRPEQEPQQQQQQQQPEFVSPSLCIPRTHANIRRERLFAVFRSLGLGWVGRIDVVEKTDEQTGAPFIRVFIHFTKWFRNDQTRKFLDHLETQKSANIVYDEPWYWKVTKSFVPAPQQPQQQQQQQPSRFPKPRIDLVGPPPPPPTTTVVSVSKPKTPSGASTSTDAATTAVSGKGKEVAKRMGYESGKGLGKKADGRIVPVQIKKNIGKNGIGFGAAVAAVADAATSAGDIPSSEEYWTKVAEATAVTTTTTATRLSVSISPPKIERRLFCDKDDVVASVASAPAKAASSHDASIAAEAIWKAAALSKST